MCRAAVVGLAVALIPMSGAAAAQDGAEPSPQQARQGERHTVTLITGDRVVVTEGKPGVQVVPGAGRQHVRMLTHGTAEQRYVIPSDAAPLVRAGKLDRRLFDVSALIEMGYDDRNRSSIPLLASGSGLRSVQDSTLADVVGTSVSRVLPAIGGSAVSTAKKTTGALWRTLTGGGRAETFSAGTERVWLDGKREATLDRSVPQIGAPSMWKSGFTGKGAKIAVLDTGVDDTHPDLAGRQAAEKNFSGAADAGDHFGHGTHVASIAAGNGERSGGKYKGVAYEAEYLDGKVLDDSGSGQESWIIAGMEWAAQQKADVANLSLGGSDTPGEDPLEKAVNRLSSDTDTLYVISSGNSGPSAGTVGSPGSADAALTVGAVDAKDRLTDFSSRGPRIGDGAIKPDVTAPGNEIVAARHSDGTIGPPVVPGYTALSGTSMAAPHTAGAAALLAQQHPGYTGERLKAMIAASAKPGKGLNAFQQGSGRVDLVRALGQKVWSTPTNVSFGVQRWPHDDDKPATRKLSYVNTGDKDVTLTLKVQASGPGGVAAPEGMFRLSAPTLTVPAGGTAAVTVTGNTRNAPKDGTYSGAVVGTAGKTTVRTALAVDREVESYDVTVRNTGRDGKPDALAQNTVANVRTGETYGPANENGTSTVRLPKGRYVLQSLAFGGTEEKPQTDILMQPVLTVDRKQTVDADARRAKPVDITAPSEKATPGLADFTVTRREGENSYGFGLALFDSDFTGVRTAQLGPQPKPDEVLTSLGTTSTEPDGARYYGLSYVVRGEVPTGFVRAPQEKDLAQVRSSYRKTQEAAKAHIGLSAVPRGDDSFGATAMLSEHPLPAERTEFVSAENLEWSHLFDVVSEEGFTVSQESPLRAFEPGKRYTQSMNRAVFGTALPRAFNSSIGVLREGNQLYMDTPLFGDGGNNLGSSVVDSSYTRIYRDGKKIAENQNPGGGQFEVPAADGAYRIATGATRGVSNLSTKVASEWTFRSAHTDRETALPVSTLRFTPKLDEANSAPGGAFTVPVVAQKQRGARFVPSSLTAEVSYDEGRTWQKAKVVDRTKLELTHPAGGGSVSLRASATDADGNTMKQTIVNAYTLR